MLKYFDWFRDNIGLKGWVTFVASTGLVGLGFYKIAMGGFTDGVTLITLAGGFIGIGRKLDKE